MRPRGSCGRCLVAPTPRFLGASWVTPARIGKMASG
uniref:Uncharacterized protein n=1 Tax=Arundo donax TaxID=35708 RepID=A0A0A8ZJU9_ARUDO